MNKRSLGALIALNMVLLGALLVVTLTPQSAQAHRRGGAQYTMVSGRTGDKSSFDVVYIINVNGAQVAAVIYESANDRLMPVGLYDFGADLLGRAQKR